MIFTCDSVVSFNPLSFHWNSKCLSVHMFPIVSASTGAIALIIISMERSVHGGVHCENCTAKACHMAKLWRFEWSQVRLELFWSKAGRYWSLEKLQWISFFFTQNFVWFYKIMRWSDRLEIFRNCSLWSALFPKMEKKKFFFSKGKVPFSTTGS